MPCRLPIFPAVMDPNLTSIRACDSRALIDMTGLGLGFYASEIVMYFKPSFFMRVRPIKYKLWKKRLFSAITTLPWKYDHHITLEVRSPHYPRSAITTLPWKRDHHITLEARSPHYPGSAITTLPWKCDHHITLEVRSPHYPGSTITTLPWKCDHHITLEVRSPHYPGSAITTLPWKWAL